MEPLQNVYSTFKPVGHISIVSFDITLIFFYGRMTEDVCFRELKLWVYGQFVLHAWLSIVAFAHLFDRDFASSHTYRGKVMSLVLKVWWILFAVFLLYNAKACMTLAPLLYWWVGCGALILSLSLILDWKSPNQTNYELSEITPPVLSEIAFSSNSSRKLEMCPICLESFNQDEIVSVLSCDHLYHPACIYEWLRKNLCCPVCRSPVDSDSEEGEEQT